MLDSAGYIKIACEKSQQEDIERALIDKIAALYAASCDLRYSDKDHLKDTPYTSDQIREFAAQKICEIIRNEGGLTAEIIDIQSGCFCLADEFLGKNSYCDRFECDDKTTYSYALSSLLESFPDISIAAEITISYHYTGDRYELYRTEKGTLIRTPALCCTCCEKIFDPAEGVYPAKESVMDFLEDESAFGICSLQCARKLSEDPSLDDYGVLDDMDEDGITLDELIEQVAVGDDSGED